MNDQQIEQEIQAKGLTAGPRVTPADIEANIVATHYFTAWDGVGALVGAWRLDVEDPSVAALRRVTVCVLVLRNGFTVTGVNECNLNPQNFDAEIAEKLARQKAVDQIWPLMGYALKEHVAGSFQDPVSGD